MADTWLRCRDHYIDHAVTQCIILVLKQLTLVVEIHFCRAVGRHCMHELSLNFRWQYSSFQRPTKILITQYCHPLALTCRNSPCWQSCECCDIFLSSLLAAIADSIDIDWAWSSHDMCINCQISFTQEGVKLSIDEIFLGSWGRGGGGGGGRGGVAIAVALPLRIDIVDPIPTIGNGEGGRPHKWGLVVLPQKNLDPLRLILMWIKKIYIANWKQMYIIHDCCVIAMFRIKDYSA